MPSRNEVVVTAADGTAVPIAATGMMVRGAAASGAAKAGNPVLVAGQDGTNAVTKLVDSSGRQVIVGAAADGAAVAGNPVLMAGQDGTNAQSLAATTGGALVTTRPGTWAVQHQPAVNTQATISQAAGGGTVKNVCTAFMGSLCSDGAPTPERVIFNLRDGATGAGTIVASMNLSLPATSGSAVSFAVTGINIVGTANTAMTVETDSAPGANVYATVSMTGYTLPS